MNLAIIPARAGSKRIRHKNTADLCGKPLIAYTIEAALEVLSPAEIVVSTDCGRVRVVASSYGVTIHDRPPDLCTDTAQLEDVAAAVIERLPARPGLVLLLQPTSPLRGPGPIREALAAFALRPACDSVVSVCELQHAQWASHINDGLLTPHYRPDIRPRTQDVLQLYAETGAIYGFRPATLAQYHCRMGGIIRPVVTDRIQAVDIDNPADLDLAARLLPLVYRDGRWL